MLATRGIAHRTADATFEKPGLRLTIDVTRESLQDRLNVEPITTVKDELETLFDELSFL